MYESSDFGTMLSQSVVRALAHLIVADLPQRYAVVVLAELVANEHIHLVAHEPHSNFGDLRGKLLNLDAVELVDVHLDVMVNVEEPLFAEEFSDYLVFDILIAREVSEELYVIHKVRKFKLNEPSVFVEVIVVEV